MSWLSQKPEAAFGRAVVEDLLKEIRFPSQSPLSGSSVIAVRRVCGLSPLQVYSRGISWTINLQTSRVRKSSKEQETKGSTVDAERIGSKVRMTKVILLVAT